MDDQYESTLLVTKECFVYRIPPKQVNARGYRAADWNVEKFLWSGRLRVTSKEELVFIRLEDAKTGELFAICEYDYRNPHAVEQVIDSSRYFALKIIDKATGNKAYIGLGFQERNEAFDFNVALQDHAKQRKRLQQKQQDDLKPKAPSADYSLKEGEKISIKIGNLKVAPKPKNDQPSGSSGFGAFSLPPPPGISTTTTASAIPRLPSAGDLNQVLSDKKNDDWGDFNAFQMGSTNPSATSKNPSGPNNPASQTGWVSFGS